jgi:hypothetical protein
MQARWESGTTTQAIAKKMRDRELKAVMVDFLKNAIGLEFK